MVAQCCHRKIKTAPFDSLFPTLSKLCTKGFNWMPVNPPKMQLIRCQNFFHFREVCGCVIFLYSRAMSTMYHVRLYRLTLKLVCCTASQGKKTQTLLISLLFSILIA